MLCVLRQAEKQKMGACKYPREKDNEQIKQMKTSSQSHRRAIYYAGRTFLVPTEISRMSLLLISELQPCFPEQKLEIAFPYNARLSSILFYKVFSTIIPNQGLFRFSYSISIRNTHSNFYKIFSDFFDFPQKKNKISENLL